MISREERVERVKRFEKACKEAGFTELGPYVFELKGAFTKTLTLSTLFHGNEIGGIEVFLNLIEELKAKKILPKSNLRLMLGNIEAYYEDKRYLEKDMNRSFDLDSHTTHDEKRAKELETYLNDSDVLIDIHQTIGPTSTPFFIFEFEKQSYNLARFLHGELPMVTDAIERGLKGKTSTGFMISKDKIGITIETGQKGIEDSQILLGLEMARKAIQLDLNAIQDFPITNTYTFAQIIHNSDGSLELVRKFNNFEPIRKGEVLARNDKEEVLSEVDGAILFPKYGTYAKVSLQLALILEPMS